MIALLAAQSLPTPSPTPLPLMATTGMTQWMVQIAFWTSVILALIKLGEVIFSITRFPRLDVRLTEDVFFRLNALGECLFCNVAILGWNAPSLVTDCRITLKKTDNVVKTFPFKVLQVGEKVKGPGPLPDHYFSGASPLRYIPESKPETILYLSIQKGYQDRTRELGSNFQNQVLDTNRPSSPRLRIDRFPNRQR